MITLARSTLVPGKIGYRLARFVGFRRVALIALGVGIGLLVAPTTGREARARLRALAEGRTPQVPPSDVAERVRYELAHSPRTWHLPQPQVEVIGGTAVLRGDVPHHTGRDDLERTAAAVAGVVGVDNHLVVTSAAGGNGSTGMGTARDGR